MGTAVRAGLTALAVALAVIGGAHAQYPVRTVRLIVPFAAGSVNDTVARFVQPQLAATLGQQVVIDNRAGAAGNLGAEVAAKSVPDGYTVMMGNLAHAIVTSQRWLRLRRISLRSPHSHRFVHAASIPRTGKSTRN
jgi:tripartite-type tricarboxylate transporter receptor subunit TctC